MRCGAIKLARNEGEAPHLGEPPVVLGVGDREAGPPAGAVLELSHEPLQRRAQAEPRGVELQHGRVPAARQRPLLHLRRQPGDPPPPPHPHRRLLRPTRGRGGPRRRGGPAPMCGWT
ncbi:Os11g0597800 [Oryza sativa Japonica Group]|uniref:Os11g0597800 protein n=1 Tax=Oryza sativa subsp. japonica TaxID=39947 RepID=C7J8R2_ORYSJ|nr:Os11g0597800 [Oryza sativa Japonica Group]|eukprot:NP_001176636.1 Os11g0597800 [Oryza sativa Japonica Group]